jgi:phenylacetate-CoA ligase
VANEYGARDAGFIARECPAGSLHVTAEELIVEIVDDAGWPLPPGEEGEIVVTNLAGPEFPFIRYRTGDRGVLNAAPCACGRALPVLGHISGRANDGLVSVGGGWVHGSAVNHLMRDLAGLRAYRITQDTREQVQVLLSLDAALPDATRDALGAHLRHLLGDTLRVEILTVDAIPPLPNGKFRHIICNVDRAPETLQPIS